MAVSVLAAPVSVLVSVTFLVSILVFHATISVATMKKKSNKKLLFQHQTG